MSVKLENTLSEISNQVQESNNKTMKLRGDNLDMAKKFRELLIQYDEKEQVNWETCVKLNVNKNVCVKLDVNMNISVKLDVNMNLVWNFNMNFKYNHQHRY